MHTASMIFLDCCYVDISDFLRYVLNICELTKLYIISVQIKT